MKGNMAVALLEEKIRKELYQKLDLLQTNYILQKHFLENLPKKK